MELDHALPNVPCTVGEVVIDAPLKLLQLAFHAVHQVGQFRTGQAFLPARKRFPFMMEMVGAMISTRVSLAGQAEELHSLAMVVGVVVIDCAWYVFAGGHRQREAQDVYMPEHELAHASLVLGRVPVAVIERGESRLEIENLAVPQFTFNRVG